MGTSCALAVWPISWPMPDSKTRKQLVQTAVVTSARISVPATWLSRKPSPKCRQCASSARCFFHATLCNTTRESSVKKGMCSHVLNTTYKCSDDKLYSITQVLLFVFLCWFHNTCWIVYMLFDSRYSTRFQWRVTMVTKEIRDMCVGAVTWNLVKDRLMWKKFNSGSACKCGK